MSRKIEILFLPAENGDSILIKLAIQLIHQFSLMVEHQTLILIYIKSYQSCTKYAQRTISF